MSKPKIQHYIWRHYLKPWTTDGLIWCKRESELQQISPKMIGQEKYFYRLSELNDSELRCLRELFEHGAPEFLLPEIRKLLTLFVAPSILKNSIDHAIFDQHRNNFLDDIHGNIEAEFIPILSNLYCCNLKMLLEEDKISTIFKYLCFQYLRTKRSKSAVSSCNPTFASIPSTSSINIENLWGPLSIITAMRMACNMLLRPRPYKLIYVNNKTNQHFITGDQPVVNTEHVYSATPCEPKSLVLYYPITPWLAIICTPDADAHSIKNESSAAQIKKYNNFISSGSLNQLYAYAESDLLRAHDMHSIENRKTPHR